MWNIQEMSELYYWKEGVMMHLDQLRYLVDLGKTGSISASAERLYVTQQAISQSMKKLENEINSTILLREKTGVTFTTAGKEVLAFAQRVLTEEMALYEKLENISVTESIIERQNLHISSASSVLNLVLPQIISKPYFKKKNYNVNISVTNDVDYLLKQIAVEETDVGFVSVNENNLMRVYTAYKDDLDLEILMQDELVAVIDKRYYDDVLYELSLSDFRSEVAMEVPVTVYNVMMINTDLYGSNLVCSTDADFHRSMMKHTGAIAFMSRQAYQYFFNKKKYVQLPLKNLEVPLWHTAIYRKNIDNSIREFIATIRTELHGK